MQLVTKIPYPVFAGSLVHIMMLDKETCEGLTSEEISANPVGTGRYRLVEHVKESYIKLVRNDEYWGELPDAETVEFRVIANAATRTTALINGEVDFISNIPVMDVDRLKDASNVQVITNPSLSCSYMGFDLLNEHGSAGTDDPNPLLNDRVYYVFRPVAEEGEQLAFFLYAFAYVAVKRMRAAAFVIAPFKHALLRLFPNF